MHLVTYSRMGVPSIGVRTETGILDIPDAASHFGRKYHVDGHSFPVRMIDLLTWEAGVEVVRQIVDRYEQSPPEERILTHSMSAVRLEAPIPRPGKIVCLGRNYVEHIKETGADVPEFPPIFAKWPSCVIGPDEIIPQPTVSNEVDWEVELAIVVGKTCKDVGEEEALDYVAGYTILNDLSARDIQFSDGQFVRGKSLDGFCPIGPSIVTRDELGAADNLRMMTKVNGVVKQDSSTSNMMYGVPQIMARLSESFTLEPGDIIATGTPSGVGFVRDPPEFLQTGDVVELTIEGIGTLRNVMG
ncbi:MAG: fumarylacetoacetate hydrolase family protein [Candidatus Thorarchaeota archaeon]